MYPIFNDFLECVHLYSLRIPRKLCALGIVADMCMENDKCGVIKKSNS